MFADKFCVIAPAALRVPGWSNVLRSFKATVWVLLLALNFSFIIGWYLLIKASRYVADPADRNPADQNPPRLINVWLNLIMIWFAVPIKLPRNGTERMFVGGLLLAHFIIAGSYQVIASRTILQDKNLKDFRLGIFDESLQWCHI